MGESLGMGGVKPQVRTNLIAVHIVLNDLVNVKGIRLVVQVLSILSHDCLLGNVSNEPGVYRAGFTRDGKEEKGDVLFLHEKTIFPSRDPTATDRSFRTRCSSASGP